MEIDYSVASDDSCRVQLFSKGHYDETEFVKACERYYYDNFEPEDSFSDLPVKKIYWRTVKAPEGSIVGDLQFIESKKGKGAYPVTVLDHWLPMNN